MALWQVGFFVLPGFSLDYASELLVSADYTFDDSLFWRESGIERRYFKEIGNFLPRTRSWTDCLDLYGDENSNRLEVLSEGENVESVAFRIDFTSNYGQALRGIVEFCILKGFIILDEQLKVVELNTESIKEVINNAPQVKKYNKLSG